MIPTICPPTRESVVTIVHFLGLTFRSAGIRAEPTRLQNGRILLNINHNYIATCMTASSSYIRNHWSVLRFGNATVSRLVLKSFIKSALVQL